MLHTIPEEHRSVLRRNVINFISEYLQPTANIALTAQLHNTPEGITTTDHLKLRRRNSMFGYTRTVSYHGVCS